MFYNMLLSKFPSGSVLSDCIFACGTVEMVVIPWNLGVQIICLLSLVSVLKRM